MTLCVVFGSGCLAFAIAPFSFTRIDDGSFEGCELWRCSWTWLEGGKVGRLLGSASCSVLVTLRHGSSAPSVSARGPVLPLARHQVVGLQKADHQYAAFELAIGAS